MSQRLEGQGIRVFKHLAVRDRKEEILAGLQSLQGDLIVITGGLGPTTDDLTRECVAAFLGQPLEFDEAIWQELARVYQARAVPIREAHRHQCFFPKNSQRLANPVGTALGFYQKQDATHFFVLPGPPRELEGMWELEVEKRLLEFFQKSSQKWHRWSFFGVAESEVAEQVEPILAGKNLEVGYRAHFPYVKVKIFADEAKDEAVLQAMRQLFPANQLPDHLDLAAEILRLWPTGQMRIRDEISDGQLAPRLFQALRSLKGEVHCPELFYVSGTATDGLYGEPQISLLMQGNEYELRINTLALKGLDKRSPPFKLPLNSERGRRFATESALLYTYNLLKSLGSRNRI